MTRQIWLWIEAYNADTGKTTLTEYNAQQRRDYNAQQRFVRSNNKHTLYGQTATVFVWADRDSAMCDVITRAVAIDIAAKWINGQYRTVSLAD